MEIDRLVKVKREKIAACMTCSLCNNLLIDATTISECLHTFCRKCVYDKILDEGLKCCPKCSMHLGSHPLEKLRADHSLQDLRDIIFPNKRRKVEAPGVASPVTVPVKRKEKSLSSLLFKAPKVVTQTSSTGRRVKPTLRMTATLRLARLKSSVETANTSKNFKSNKKVPNTKSKSSDVQENEVRRTEHERSKDKPKSGEKVNVDNISSISVEPRRSRRIWKRRLHDNGDSGTSSQVVLDANSQRAKRPVWFSLVASKDREEALQLPQIPTSYLRIKDGNIPVSVIQKYLVKKLSLSSESVVEISCMGIPVKPTQLLYDLVYKWLESVHGSERISATVGSSGKEFVTVLAYARKAAEAQ